MSIIYLTSPPIKLQGGGFITAKKLPSGSWRCQVFAGTEKVTMPDGTVKEKKIRKSFTVDDPSPAGKRLCEKLAAEWAADHEDKNQTDITVKEAIEQYCELKRAVLSPSTIKGYKTILRNRIGAIGGIKLSSLKSKDVQTWVNNLALSVSDKSKKKLSPKTVKNSYGLLSAVLESYDIRFRITLPQQVPPDLYVPSDADIKVLIDYFSVNDKEMLKAVYLAAFGSLRRSEVCALTADDIVGNVVHVHHAVVENDSNEIVEKTTKTYKSYRDVPMPGYIIKEFPREGKIVNLTPQAVSHRFTRTLEKLGLPQFRFHDLRHYTASIMHALMIPDQYIMERGGWSGDGALKRIYRNTMDDYSKKFNDVLMGHFSEFEKSSHESSHDEEKIPKNGDF